MLEINENNRVYGEDIHNKIGSKTKKYEIWLPRAIKRADLQLNNDYVTKLLESTGGRPKTQYEFTIDAAKEICITENNEKGKELRRWLIGLSKSRENLELITVKEAAFAFKVINCLKYIDNQKEAYTIHQTAFISENNKNLDPKYIYSEFAKYRAKITGWDKEKTNKAINEYLNNHSGYNRNKLLKKDMSTKLSIIDIGEAIRVAVLDILYSQKEDYSKAESFSKLCKKLAHEMQIEPDKKNETNLFKSKESILSVKHIALK